MGAALDTTGAALGLLSDEPPDELPLELELELPPAAMIPGASEQSSMINSTDSCALPVAWSSWGAL